MALSLFRDQDFITPQFESLGYYSEPDFVALGKCYGLSEAAVRAIVGEFVAQEAKVADMVAASLMSDGAKGEYMRIFRDRLAMFRRGAPNG